MINRRNVREQRVRAVNASDVSYCKKRKLIKDCLTEGSQRYTLRLDASVPHHKVKYVDSNGVVKRLHCIVCCKKCFNNTSLPHKRDGRQTRYICSVCQVPLCKYCFNTFHSMTLVSPVCVPV